MKTRLITAVLVLMAGLLVLASQCTNDNVRPVPLFTVDRVDGPSPLTVNFDGSGSYDPDGTVEAYSWNFGDGASRTGVTTSHTFTTTTDRTYTVRLTVTDGGGKSATTSASIFVIGSGSGGATLFFDDFSNGLDPEWDVTPGWESDGGMLIHQNGNAWAYVGRGASWTDYQIDVDLDPRRESAGIVIRCQEDLQSYVMLYGSTSKLKCVTYLNGSEIDDTGYSSPGFFEGEQHVRIEADGVVIRIYINDNLRLTVEDIPFLSGMPGLFSSGSWSGGSQARFDNFQVTALE